MFGQTSDLREELGGVGLVVEVVKESLFRCEVKDPLVHNSDFVSICPWGVAAAKRKALSYVTYHFLCQWNK